MAIQATADVRVATEPYERPWPNVDHDNEGFWEGLRNHRLLLWQCRQCGAWYWPRAFCQKHENEPWAENIQLAEASGRGKVFAFNIHHWSFHPGFKDLIPYVYALVELEEGPLLSSMLVDIDPPAMKVGMRVEIVYEDHPNEGFTLPLFKPAEAAHA